MKRFVVVATLRRGVLPKPRVLDDAGQAEAFWRLRMDESQAVRVRFELGMDEARVVWNRKGAA